MAWRQGLTALMAGMGGAAIVIVAGLVWNSASNGGFVRVLGGVTADELSRRLPVHPGASASAKWQAFAGPNGYNPACDYRLQLIIARDKAAKMSIDLSRYAGDASFIYPTSINGHVMQALILAPGEPISVEISDRDGGGCDRWQAALSNLPGLCFDTKIEQRC
jgi:hypothetical protein